MKTTGLIATSLLDSRQIDREGENKKIIWKDDFMSSLKNGDYDYLKSKK